MVIHEVIIEEIKMKQFSWCNVFQVLNEICQLTRVNLVVIHG